LIRTTILWITSSTSLNISSSRLAVLRSLIDVLEMFRGIVWMICHRRGVCLLLY
jgi:hypothetical protein